MTDGRLPIDNNDVELVSRKNRLFVSSVAARERAADFLTLVSRAVRNDLEVWAYIEDVLDQLAAGSSDNALRPGIWSKAQPESSRQYRVQERRDRVHHKQRRRTDGRRPPR